MIYTCRRCGYETQIKQNLLKHLSKVVECPPDKEDVCRNTLIKDINILKRNTGKIKCNYCDALFTAYSNKSRHMKTCKGRGVQEPTEAPKSTEEQISQLLINVKELEKKIIEIKKVKPQINITNNNFTNINLQTANIKNFGSENMEAIPVTLVRDLFLNLKYRDLIENLHCDPNFPENHNVRIRSLKKNQLEIYRDNTWDIVTFVNGLNELLLQGNKIFRDYYRKNKEMVLEDMSLEELNDVLQTLDDIDNLKKQTIKPLHDDLHCMLEVFRGKSQAQQVSLTN